METKITESAEAITERLLQECKFSKYDKQKLESNLQTLVTTGQITEEMMKAILDCLDPEGKLDENKMKPIRAQLKKANQLVASALEASRKE